MTFSLGKSSRSGNLGLISNAECFRTTGCHGKRTDMNGHSFYA